MIDKVLGVGREVAKIVDERAKDWGRFVADEPEAAAATLDFWATRLEASADRLARRRRFRRKLFQDRIRAVAKNYREEAERIRRERC